MIKWIKRVFGKGGRAAEEVSPARPNHRLLNGVMVVPREYVEIKPFGGVERREPVSRPPRAASVAAPTVSRSRETDEAPAYGMLNPLTLPQPAEQMPHSFYTSPSYSEPTSHCHSSHHSSSYDSSSSSSYCDTSSSSDTSGF